MKSKSNSDFTRVISHALHFYRERIKLIILFSIPFFFAFLIPLLLPSPTYMALGGVFIRGGSIPTLSIPDWGVTAIAYLISIFIISDSAVNINLIIKSKRTLTNSTTEVINAMGQYATKIFMISTIMSLLLSALFLILYDQPIQSLIYPLASLALMVLFFFAVPAVVIDERDTITAMMSSFAVVVKKPLFVLMWLVISIVLFLVFGFISYLLPTILTPYVFLFFNSIIILPFLLVLSTQMYMEKYPLAR